MPTCLVCGREKHQTCHLSGALAGHVHATASSRISTYLHERSVLSSCASICAESDLRRLNSSIASGSFGKAVIDTPDTENHPGGRDGECSVTSIRLAYMQINRDMATREPCLPGSSTNFPCSIHSESLQCFLNTSSRPIVVSLPSPHPLAPCRPLKSRTKLAAAEPVSALPSKDSLRELSRTTRRERANAEAVVSEPAQEQRA